MTTTRTSTIPPRRRGFTDVGMCLLILTVLAILAAGCMFYAMAIPRFHPAMVGSAPWALRPAERNIQMFIGSFAAVLGLGFLICALFFMFVRRQNRRLRREIGIPWATNGHGTRTMHSELHFQQTLLQLQSKLGVLEDKAHHLETILMQRAVEGD